MSRAQKFFSESVDEYHSGRDPRNATMDMLFALCAFYVGILVTLWITVFTLTCVTSAKVIEHTATDLQRGLDEVDDEKQRCDAEPGAAAGSDLRRTRTTDLQRGMDNKPLGTERQQQFLENWRKRALDIIYRVDYVSDALNNDWQYTQILCFFVFSFLLYESLVAVLVKDTLYRNTIDYFALVVNLLSVSFVLVPAAYVTAATDEVLFELIRINEIHQERHPGLSHEVHSGPLRSLRKAYATIVPQTGSEQLRKPEKERLFCTGGVPDHARLAQADGLQVPRDVSDKRANDHYGPGLRRDDW